METESPRPHETIRSQLRLPAGLHQRVIAASEESGRSMNAEIVHRLEESFSSSRKVDYLPSHYLEELNSAEMALGSFALRVKRHESGDRKALLDGLPKAIQDDDSLLKDFVDRTIDMLDEQVQMALYRYAESLRIQQNSTNKKPKK